MSKTKTEIKNNWKLQSFKKLFYFKIIILKNDNKMINAYNILTKMYMKI